MKASFALPLHPKATAVLIWTALQTALSVVGVMTSLSAEPFREKKKPADPSAAMDEPMSGQTMLGTPVHIRKVCDFPAESRDLFWQMDQVASGPGGALQPLDFDQDGDGHISGTLREEKLLLPGTAELDAIRGRNTWLLWGGGNEAFWGWLQEKGYGLADFQILMDGRKRSSRFHDSGFINQPGFLPNNGRERVLGLFLDIPDADQVKLTLPPEKPGEAPRRIHAYEVDYPEDKLAATPPFDPATDDQGKKMLDEATAWLKRADDGVNPRIYGYPSGIVGLRLMLNPDFFGTTKEATAARQKWQREVINVKDSASYYNPDSNVSADPDLIRPFRVAMSCAFCHVGPHPLNPPRNPEAPGWYNLSSMIGNQYWRPQPSFGNRLKEVDFIYHFLHSQQPGTIDTSLVSTDHINNANSINAIFDVPQRLQRATLNTPEEQGDASLLVPSIEDSPLANPRHTPRILLDGSDSSGAFSALIRVPLNIGTFSEEWMRCHNPVIGFRSQTPFRILSAQRNSVFWQVNENYRIPYLARFFTLSTSARRTPAEKDLAAQSSTAPMKLRDARDASEGTANGGKNTGLAKLEADGFESQMRGRTVFLENCAICHSSKQPKDFQIQFQRLGSAQSWTGLAAPEDSHFVLPADFKDWADFKRSPAYAQYVCQIKALADEGFDAWRARAGEGREDDPFIKDNYLSSEIRVPITLVGTNSGRAVATNAMAGQVWDNFSSQAYKHLPAVGEIAYFDVFTATSKKYSPPGGGPGYYRPPSLISLWATAPYLHNNSLGGFYPYRGDPASANPTSVAARLDAFQDGMTKLLYADRRPLQSTVPGVTFEPRPGDLRGLDAAANNDPGYIYRIPQDTCIGFNARFIRPLMTGLVGEKTMFVAFLLWLVFLAIWGAGLFWGAARHAGVLLVFLALFTALIGVGAGMGASGGTAIGSLLMVAAGITRFPLWNYWLWVGVLLVMGSLFLFAPRPSDRTERTLKYLVILPFALYGFAFLSLLKATPDTLLAVVAFGIFAVIVLAIWCSWKRGDWAVKFTFVFLFGFTLLGGLSVHYFLDGRFGDLKVGSIPKGVPVNLIMNLDPEKGPELADGVISLVRAVRENTERHLKGPRAYDHFMKVAGASLMAASKCPDFVLDRGHLFGEVLDPEPGRNEQAKKDLIAFLKTL